MAMADFCLTQELHAVILELASRPSVHSVSCPFTGFELWEGLLKEQVRRSRATGLHPHEAFFLAGPDGGIPGMTPDRFADDEDQANAVVTPDPITGRIASDLFGGYVHIPYEGVCGGDLFIAPDWYRLSPEMGSTPDASLSRVLGSPGKKCNLLLTHRDMGELPCATRQVAASWYLYAAMSEYEDCRPMRRRTTKIRG